MINIKILVVQKLNFPLAPFFPLGKLFLKKFLLIMGQLQGIFFHEASESRTGALQGNTVIASHFFKLVYTAKRISSALFSSVPSTTPCVGTIIHMVNQIATLIQVEI